MKMFVFVSLLVISLLLATSSGEINEQELRKYIDKDVFVVLNYTTVCGLYGRITDVLYIDEELHIVLDTNYRQGRILMFLSAKNISYIRGRKTYE